MPDDLEIVVMFNIDEIMAAKESECKNWKDYVYDEVEDQGQNVVCEEMGNYWKEKEQQCYY